MKIRALGDDYFLYRKFLDNLVDKNKTIKLAYFWRIDDKYHIAFKDNAGIVEWNRNSGQYELYCACEAYSQKELLKKVKKAKFYTSESLIKEIEELEKTDELNRIALSITRNSETLIRKLRGLNENK